MMKYEDASFSIKPRKISTQNFKGFILTNRFIIVGMLSIGNMIPASKLATKRKINPPSIACCWFFAKVEINVPTFTVENTNAKTERPNKK